MKKLSTKELTLIPLFSVLFAISAWITVPIGAIPFTMQTFAIFFAIYILGSKLSAYSLIIYLLLGAVGLPVFAGFGSGIGIIIGPTGGYLLGFFMPIITLHISNKISKSKVIVPLISSIVGLVLCYTIGTIWFIYVYTQSSGAISIVTTLGLTVFPFVIPDLIKIALAFIMGKKLKPYLNLSR